MIKLNGCEINIKKFPNGESLILNDFSGEPTNKKVSGIRNTIELKFESDEDLLHLIFIKKEIDSLCPNTPCELLIPYLPYSRMDRTEGKTVFTLKWVCDIINSLFFDRVKTMEAHSNVSLALLNRVVNIDTTIDLVEKLLHFYHREDCYLFYPDEGALKRYGKKIKHDKVLCGQKERDFSTGEIKKFSIVGETPKKPFNVIIADDLCSYGGTFIASANALKAIGADKIYLAVTHCEKTILNGDVLTGDLITSVETTNSIIDIKDIPEELKNKITIRNIF